MTYQQLDAIADSYIPLLGIMTLFWFVIKGKRSGLRSALGDASTTILGAVYILSLIHI